MNTSTSYDRFQGALEAFKQRALKIDQGLVINGTYERASGYTATQKLLDHKKPISAIFAFNDVTATGVLKALRDRQIKVPDDMAVIGFDDIEVASLPGIDLTTVSEKKTVYGAVIGGYPH